MASVLPGFEYPEHHVINALLSTRIIKPGNNNWLLFSAMVETALLKFHKQYDAVRVEYAIKQHEQWYKGDGVYGDGPEFHFGYDNSYLQSFIVKFPKDEAYL